MHVISCGFYKQPAATTALLFLERFPINMANIAPIEIASQFGVP
jgi:hypothetical protein